MLKLSFEFLIMVIGKKGVSLLYQNKDIYYSYSPYISLLCFAISLLIHITLGLVLTGDFLKQTERPPVEVVFINQDISKTIVSQEDFNGQVPEEHSSYLSRGDQVVEKQTQAMMKGLFRQAGMDDTESSSGPVHRSPATITNPDGSRVGSGHSIEFAFPGFAENPNTKKFPVIKKRIAGQSQTTDFLVGVELGSHTLLNTRAFTYYTYFDRMKKRIYLNWIQQFETTDFFLSFANKNLSQLFVTYIVAFLFPDGELKDLQVVQSSGNEDIDSAALNAFLYAAPFPNPPPGLVDEENQQIPINKTFYFYVNPPQRSNFFSSGRSSRL